jgi:predicted metal-dependent enzyme (double-stranded beta helix superfamily)
MVPYTLADFIHDMTAILAREREARRIVEAGKPALEKLLWDPMLVPEPYRQVVHDHRPSQFLLYRAGDNTLTVSVVVWGPGHSAAPHDHQTWGMLGLYAGQMCETRYRRVDDGSNPRQGKLQQIDVVQRKAGEVWHLLPPDEEIHALENRSSMPAIEIHVYGRDLLHLPRQMFNPHTGSITLFQTTAYD